jgi:hypothetical protein
MGGQAGAGAGGNTGAMAQQLRVFAMLPLVLLLLLLPPPPPWQPTEYSAPAPTAPTPHCRAGNVAAGLPLLDTASLPPSKADRVPSPSALGKRNRAMDGDAPVSARGSPSKLRGALQRHMRSGQ